MSYRKKRVAIIHPDLGIGGAESLIINLAIALQDTGYDVKIYTPYFDPNRCFQEIKEHNLQVEVRGSWFPRSLFCGKFIALCAYIRMFLCSLWVVLFGGSKDYYILDQVSFSIPLIRIRNKNVLFYCHHPDKLLSTDRKSIFKKIYRFFLDFIEEITTGCSRCIVVNSNYTLKVFYDSFSLIRKHCKKHRPKVLYPSIQEKTFNKTKGFQQTIQDLLGKEFQKDEQPQKQVKNNNNSIFDQQNMDITSKLKNSRVKIFTSLNRYERKKNINLALESYAYYLQKSKDLSSIQDDSYLVIAGGYDQRLPENVEHHQELVQLSQKLKIEDKIIFLKSINNDQRLLLLENTHILLYTPENEHFGIVPVEAMYMGCIVIACNSGGPLESVDHEKTGFLLSPDPQEWGEKLLRIMNTDPQEIDVIRENAQKRVKSMFTFRVFAQQLDNILKAM